MNYCLNYEYNGMNYFPMKKEGNTYNISSIGDLYKSNFSIIDFYQR